VGEKARGCRTHSGVCTVMVRQGTEAAKCMVTKGDIRHIAGEDGHASGWEQP
jgi:hypothetical protein